MKPAHDRRTPPRVHPADRAPLGSLEVLRARLLASLEDEPLEDGMTHAAEELLREAILGHPEEAEQWLTQIISSNGPTTQAGILQCLGRLHHPEVIQAAEEIASRAFSSPDVGVRESAIGVVEQWGTPSLIEALRRHQEATPWLSRYAEKVLRDLSV